MCNGQKLPGKRTCHKDIRGSGGIAPLIALYGNEWPTSGSGSFTPGERDSGTALNRRLGGPCFETR
jgi:hypothetical protein